MAALELELNLPDSLAREAEAEGLLTPEAIASLLSEELRRRRVDHLFTTADRLSDSASSLLNEEEIEAEIMASRQERRAPHASRG